MRRPHRRERLVAGDHEDRRITVQFCDLSGGMRLFDYDRQRIGAGTEVEDAVARVDASPSDELAFQFLFAQEGLGEEIVEGG
jgi:hypothetical protein